MASKAISIERNGRDDSAWLLILLLLVPLAALQAVDPFAIELRGLAAPCLFLALLAVIAGCYRRWRPSPVIVTMLGALQQMILFSALASVLSYMLAAHGGPYWDARLQGWDRALGLDWNAYLAFVNAYPALGTAYRLAYQSLIPQMVVLIVGLGFAGRLRELRIVMVAAMLAGIVTVLVSGLTPAMSNFVFLELAPEHYSNLRPAAAFVHVGDMEGLRSGALRTLALDRMQGIVTFPSYHAALAAVFVWGFLKMPLIRWAGVAVALLTILATPIDGGHYFVDVIAGCAIAASSLWFARRAIHFDAAAWLRRALAERRGAFKAWPFRHSHGSSAR